jgi:hypothetical protein
MRSFGFLLSLVVAVSACSSSSSGESFASQFCAKASSCGESIPLCQGAFSAIVVSSSCQDMLVNISCADLSAPAPPAWFTACFPPCTTPSPVCNGDGTITECDSGMTLVVDCAKACSAESLSYAGTCGTSYGSQTSTMAKCWCH